MKLSVSNIAWDAEEEETILPALRDAGVLGIEVAPTKVWPGWVGATIEAAEALRNRFAKLGLAIPAVQSLLFDRPELCLFADKAGRRLLGEHLVMVGRLARALGARTLIFGSPRNRDRGCLQVEDAMRSAASFLAVVAEDLADLGVCLCIEANPAAYDCNFVTRWIEAAELVNRVGTPGIGLHLDVACTVLAGDDPVVAIRQCGTSLRHFHVSEPRLGGFSRPSIDHLRVGRALTESGYNQWISIEMRRGQNSCADIDEAVRYVKRCYLNG